MWHLLLCYYSVAPVTLLFKKYLLNAKHIPSTVLGIRGGECMAPGLKLLSVSDEEEDMHGSKSNKVLPKGIRYGGE